MSYIGQSLGQGQAERFIFTASGSETSISADDDGVSIGYTVGQVSVYLNGVKLVSGVDFVATNGSTITSLAALTAADVVEIIALSTFSPADTVAASGGTFTGNVSFGDNNITNVGDTITADGSSITVNTDTALAAGVDLETSTTGSVKQKGAFMQSSTHQALALGG